MKYRNTIYVKDKDDQQVKFFVYRLKSSRMIIVLGKSIMLKRLLTTTWIVCGLGVINCASFTTDYWATAFKSSGGNSQELNDESKSNNRAEALQLGKWNKCIQNGGHYCFFVY